MKGNANDAFHRHVGDMSDSMADQYISFCEKALLGSTGKGKYSHVLLFLRPRGAQNE